VQDIPHDSNAKVLHLLATGHTVDKIVVDLTSDPFLPVGKDHNIPTPTGLNAFGDTEYEMEDILDCCVSSDHEKVEYKVCFVRWDEDWWIPEENFQSYNMFYTYERAHPTNPNWPPLGHHAFENMIKHHLIRHGVLLTITAKLVPPPVTTPKFQGKHKANCEQYLIDHPSHT
jgi:hypothetical protein